MTIVIVRGDGKTAKGAFMAGLGSGKKVRKTPENLQDWKIIPE